MSPILDRSSELFGLRVERTHRLLEQHGLAMRDINPTFVEHWVREGKQPEEIVIIAIGRRRPDAHLGGTDV